MTNRAQFNTRTADLTTEFGESMARKWFGDEAVDALPKFVRGKNNSCRIVAHLVAYLPLELRFTPPAIEMEA